MVGNKQLALWLVCGWAGGGCIETPTFVAAEVAVADGDVNPGLEIDAGPDQPLDVEVVNDATSHEGVDGNVDGDRAEVTDLDAEPVEVAGCMEAADCDDDNVCTLDDCDAGVCSNVPTSVGGSCDDGFACTVSDSCGLEGTCSGTIVVCDDGNPCTQDTCDPGTGACVFGPVPDGQSCSLGLSCQQACTAGACGCDCGDESPLLLMLGGETVPMEMKGTFTLNPDGSAVDAQYETMASAGPLTCQATWLDSGQWLPQLSAFPTEVVWERACASPDGFSDAATAYLGAGGSYWHAKDAGIPQEASLLFSTAVGQPQAALSNFHVVGVEPPVGECTTTESVTMRANYPEDLQLMLQIGGLPAMRMAYLELVVGPNPAAVLKSPLDWSNGLVPLEGDWATFTIINPCGGDVTDTLFGDQTVELWGNEERSGEFYALGFNNTVLGSMSIYGAIATEIGTCVGGSRTIVIDAALVQASL